MVNVPDDYENIQDDEKISSDQFLALKRSYDPMMRFGQFFLNKHCPKGKSFPRLYYETNPNRAQEIISKNFVRW